MSFLHTSSYTLSLSLFLPPSSFLYLDSSLSFSHFISDCSPLKLFALSLFLSLRSFLLFSTVNSSLSFAFSLLLPYFISSPSLPMSLTLPLLSLSLSVPQTVIFFSLSLFPFSISLSHCRLSCYLFFYPFPSLYLFHSLPFSSFFLLSPFFSPSFLVFSLFNAHMKIRNFFKKSEVFTFNSLVQSANPIFQSTLWHRYFLLFYNLNKLKV